MNAFFMFVLIYIGVEIGLRSPPYGFRADIYVKKSHKAA